MNETEQKNIINTQVKQPKEWIKTETSTFFRFEKIGDCLEGLLISKDKNDRYGFGMYKLKQFDGELKKFHGSEQLDDLLHSVDIPTYVKIVYIDDLSLPPNTMKVFELYIGKN